MKQKTSALKTWFLTGLLVLVPLAITLWVLSLIIGTMDQSLALLPSAWQPDRLLGVKIPGLGAILTLLFILAIGYLGNALVPIPQQEHHGEAAGHGAPAASKAAALPRFTLPP